jgi:tetratricopeptide (TPR) repeat protein
MSRKSNEQRERALQALVTRYERVVREGKEIFLGEEEFEELLAHYFGHHDYDTTLEVADLAISQHHYTPDFYKWKALIHKINLEEDEALSTLEQLHIYAPNDEEVMMLRLEVFVHFEHREEARAALDQLYNTVDEESKLSLLAFFDGLLCMQENRFRESFTALAEAIRLDAYQEPAYDELLNAPELSAFRREIGEFLQQQTDRDPFNDLTWFYLGMWYDDGGDDLAALDAFANARSLNAERGSYDLEYADKLFDLEMYEPCLRAYTAYFASDEGEESYETAMRIGRSHQMLEQIDAARKAYFRALELDPGMYDIYQYIAECAVAQEKWGVAAYNYGRAVELPNHTPDCWLGLALCSSATNAPLEAERAFLKAIDLDEQYSDAYVSYALFLIENGRERDALSLLDEAIERYQDGPLAYGRAAMLLLSHRRKAALAALHEALASFYDERDVLFGWHPELRDDPEVLALLQFHQ